MPKNDMKLEEDPYLRLGFGMNAYYDTLRYLMIMMFLIFLFCIPTMVIYSSYDGIVKDPKGPITQFSLGNMGGASTMCKQGPLDLPMPVKCKTGFFQPDLINMTYGIMPSNADNKNLCINDKMTTQCNTLLDKPKLFNSLNETCGNKSNCTLPIFNQFFLATADTTSDLYKNCSNVLKASFFIQIPCIYSENEENTRQIQGLFIGCMGVFIALFFVVYVDYMRSVFKNLFVEWDVKTITAGDYTVELDIAESMWKEFIDTKYDRLSGQTKIEAFRDYIKNEMEERLTNLPDLGYEEEAPDRIRIAMITFAFDNARLINLLRVRGTAIKFENYDKMREINGKIDELKSDGNELLKLNRPVTAFLSFENEEGLNRCTNYNETVLGDRQYMSQGYDKLLGQPLDIEEAAEPTDIIWENRHFTSFQRFRRSLIVIGCVFCLLFISFCIIFFCSKTATAPLLRYPSSVNCTELNATYSNPKTFKINAMQEWWENEPLIKAGKDTRFNGFTQCYC